MKPVIALATAPIKSALHIIRISGDNCFSIVSRFFSVNLTKDKKKSIHFGYLTYQHKTIDQVVVLTYPHPHSFTGEDVVEIITHGNLLIDQQIIDLMLANGMRMATNGEFSSRAYLNHKIDLVQAEAINDLINATSKESQEIISYALKGETSKLLLPIKKSLLDLIANLEVNIDYPEYQDIEVVNRKKIKQVLSKCQNTIRQLIKDGSEGLIIKDGLKVAIIGKPNVGKSTLLNALLKEDKAIVTNIPGTTRDIVEGDVNLDGITLHLLDTAGIRVSKNKIETIGVKKTFKAIKEADLVVYLKDRVTDERLVNLPKQKVIEVINKADLIKKKDSKHLYISAKKGNITPLIKAIKRLAGVSDATYHHPSFANARELGLLKRADTLISEILNENKKQTPMDIMAVLLNDLLNNVQEIFGEKASLDLTKEIFSRFCVGK
ncbi:MAG: tRNA uridine-5-carboxymethylaminomethyl(34) synthesis GTPase MnmE [Bacilli bacterium]|nr:tRNA uridine-5-carboxymethylaminomethyl(34) synthesis GTPase MnmE [Bacilli bacterium]